MVTLDNMLFTVISYDKLIISYDKLNMFIAMVNVECNNCYDGYLYLDCRLCRGMLFATIALVHYVINDLSVSVDGVVDCRWIIS